MNGKVKRGGIVLAAAFCAVGALAGEAPAEEGEKKPLPALPERYQKIVDRQMFGPLPEGFDPLKPASAVSKADERAAAEAAAQLAKEQEKIKSAIRFSMINRKADGTVMVGFTDSSNPKEVRNFYLKVGETRDGWTVREADPLKATMTIEKDGVEVFLALGGDSSKDDKANRRVGGQAASASPSGPRNGLAGSAPGGGSLRERREQRRLRRQQEAAAQEEKIKKMQEDFDRKRAEQEQKQAEEKQKAEEERQNTRQQLLAIQEQLKRAREEKSAREAPAKDGEDGTEE